MPDRAEIFRSLRAQVLALTPTALGLTPLPTGVWGALMEFTMGGTWVSLVAILDGTTSLYFGSGGGIIGAGKHQAVRKANRAFLQLAEQFVQGFHKVESYPLPGAGQVHFYLLAADGVYGSDEIEESALAARSNPLLPLFSAAQQVITQIRLVAVKSKT